MRFEIAKLRIEQLTGQRVSWSTEKLGLLADNLKLQDKNQKQERAYVELHTLFEKTRSKLTWANVERWAWRVVAIVGAYIFLQKIPPL
ncbi:hypothetical protein BWI97_07250 [Siphonobacter sp. BAB-5405]|uniref:hypothetical protein n=1 Tax=Siphonobacter sp. BAB-5405 TaxID=1864825 RepID=UPI000C80CF72|nr:hypothetical protein [Siphonobacter sp. BAB-5405]PMD97419.1 hypothetical protein BWI97_07250 [Siphonobacter sp. BAB-5405]